MKRILFFSICILFGSFAFGQKERKFIREGNSFFEKGIADTIRRDSISFSKAETEYRKALEIKKDDYNATFNLGDALYKQNKFEQAGEIFENLTRQSINSTERSKSFYNLGNSRLMQQKLDESIESYKNALRNNPNDMAAKYNLAFAQKMKQQQQQQQQNQDNKDNKNNQNDPNKDQQKDQNKDQKKDQDKNKDQKKDQNKDQNQEQKKNEQKKQQNPPKISKQNAEKLLQALNEDEKKTQEKVKKAKAAKAKSSKIEKDW